VATRVIFVRHGESSYNVERRVQGFLDESTLTEKGREMARQVGVALKDLAFDAAYTSPLRRAKDTAEIILSELRQPPTLQIDPSLKEINLALWEGLLFTEVEEKYPDQYQQWHTAPHELRMPIVGEDGKLTDYYPVPTLYERAKQFWQTVLPQHANQTILIVGHSGINRALISTAIGLEADTYQVVNQANCAISVLNFAGGFGSPVQIESLNQTAHLGAPIPKSKAKKGARILLVRHGETQWNREKRFQGQIDVPLNENGKRQGQQAAEFLKEIPLRYAVTSPLLRPKETAEIILQYHPNVTLEFEDDLKEISHGLWEGKFEEEIAAEYPGMLEQWQLSPETVQMPEGENLQDVWDRAIAAWNQIVDTAANRPEPGITMVVAHDAINKAILCHVAGLGPESFWRFKQGNGAVSVIDYPEGLNAKPILMASNITSHLAGGVLDKTAAGAL